jgi:hypothetical protein
MIHRPASSQGLRLHRLSESPLEKKEEEEEFSHEQNSSVCFVMQLFVGRQSLPHPNRDA